MVPLIIEVVPLILEVGSLSEAVCLRRGGADDGGADSLLLVTSRYLSLPYLAAEVVPTMAELQVDVMDSFKEASELAGPVMDNVNRAVPKP